MKSSFRFSRDFQCKSSLFLYIIIHTYIYIHGTYTCVICGIYDISIYIYMYVWYVYIYNIHIHKNTCIVYNIHIIYIMVISGGPVLAAHVHAIMEGGHMGRSCGHLSCYSLRQAQYLMLDKERNISPNIIYI